MKCQFALVVGALLASTCAFAADSTFHKTCRDIALSRDGSTITANRSKVDGSLRKTSVTLKGVQNVDGVVTMVGGETTYQKTCKTVNLKIPSKANQLEHPTLTAICTMKNGHPKNTQLFLVGIDNVDGVLTQK